MQIFPLSLIQTHSLLHSRYQWDRIISLQTEAPTHGPDMKDSLAYLFQDRYPNLPSFLFSKWYQLQQHAVFCLLSEV